MSESYDVAGAWIHVHRLVPHPSNNLPPYWTASGEVYPYMQGQTPAQAMRRWIRRLRTVAMLAERDVLPKLSNEP